MRTYITDGLREARLSLKRSDCMNTRYLKKNAPTILSGLGVVGVIGTAALAVKATPKAMYILEEKEKEKGDKLTKFEFVMTAAPVYIPAILMGASTITCVLSANYLNKEKQAMLTSAYAYLNTTYNEYRTTVKEIFGEDADDKVKAEIAKKRYTDVTKPEPNKKLFYDQFSERYFEATEQEVMDAVLKLNRHYSIFSEATLNDFYDLLDLEPTDYGGVLGWSYARDLELFGYSWIDVKWTPLTMPDNLEAYVITFPIDPSEDYYGY